ncbi:MAG: CaiB/BaiF CoA transferase family protein [Brevibacterium sp.]
MTDPLPETVRGPLDGLLVLEVATVIMAPMAGRLLAKLGADVIRVEAPAGDVIRRSGQSRSPGMPGVALSLGDGKRNITLDLKKSDDLETMSQLIKIADMVITNHLPHQREKFALDWGSVSALNPRCILVTAQGFSSDSDSANVPAYDDTIQAASGLSDIYRKSSGTPRYAPYVIADKVCGLSMVYAGLAAVHRRNIAGVGQWVDVPMLDVMADFNLIEQLNDYSFEPPLGEAGWHRTINPARHPHQTKDGWMCILPYSDANWRTFLGLVDPVYSQPEVDIPLPTNRDRNAHVEEMQKIIGEFAEARTNEEVIADCHRSGIPAQAVVTVEDLTTDSYLRGRGSIEMVDNPNAGHHWRTSPNIGYSESPIQPVRPAARIDEDRDTVLALIDKDG